MYWWLKYCSLDVIQQAVNQYFTDANLCHQYTVNQLFFVAIMFHVFLLQDSSRRFNFAITKMLKFQIFRGMTLVYIAADIGCFFITRVVFHNILLIVQLTYPIDFVNTYVLVFLFKYLQHFYMF
jgi:hypothetical protein